MEIFCITCMECKWWNRELTLKCKLKCYVKPMKDPLGISPSKGNQGTTWGKEKILLTSVGIEPMTSGLDLLLLCRMSNEVSVGLSWVSHSTLIYTSELILCFTICMECSLATCMYVISNIWIFGKFLFKSPAHQAKKLFKCPHPGKITRLLFELFSSFFFNYACEAVHVNMVY